MLSSPELLSGPGGVEVTPLLAGFGRGSGGSALAPWGIFVKTSSVTKYASSVPVDVGR